MKRSRGSKTSWWEAAELAAVLVCVLFLVALIGYGLSIPLGHLGILPRTRWGLIGILFSPLLHQNAAHLFANAFPLFILLSLIFWEPRYRPEETLCFIWFVSGFGTWLIGRGNTIHIGASSIIYGLVVYLIAAGFWIRRWRAVWIALAVLICYGGIFYGLLPQNGPISWEGHLCGAVAGFWAAERQHRK